MVVENAAPETASQLAEATVEVSVVMPCLNERQGIAACVDSARNALAEAGIRGEVVVADNGSEDGSAEIACAHGARVVHEARRGYGSAYQTGIEAARGRYIVIGDADGTYDFHTIERFIKPLRDGYDFVIGNRFEGRMAKGAMPTLHRYVGNPVLSAVLRGMFKTAIGDAHCGMRSFTREAYDRMELQTTGMEFASEMVIHAARAKLRMLEIPIDYGARAGDSKLRTFRDGWRHLRFMFLYSPDHLFIVPGVILFLIGFVIMARLAWGPVVINGRVFDIHFMLVGGFLTIVSVQVLCLGVLGKAYSFTEHFQKDDKLIAWLLRHFTLEKALLIGAVGVVLGLVFAGGVVWKWVSSGFGELQAVRPLFFGLVVLVNSLQFTFNSFLFSMMAIPKRPRDR
ncbi:MAG: glycosyltransferase family 2 protein [Verrucomicrobia bacterium]|nr:glycosyltransferase family 2 protein [Verrucomicrobiota bacterium]